MKSWIVWLGLLILLVIPRAAKSQVQEAQQLLLNVEKLAQLKSVLEDLKKGYEMVAKGYGTIKDLSRGNFSLHQRFLDNLLGVSPAVKNYWRVADIVLAQKSILKEGKAAFQHFVRSRQFVPGEVNYLKSVYDGLLTQSLKNIEALVLIITAGKLRMSDEERINAINGIWKEVSEELTFLRVFNRDTKILAIQRAQAVAEAKRQKDLFSIHH